MNILAKNLLVLASAGSGKTFQLGNRVIGLVARGAEPERIVALTFTRKAAGEFADSVLTKLAEAAHDEVAAASLREALALPDADFHEVLDRVVRSLSRITLGTMDGFFSKVVRSFQYELGLTGGKFDLLEGARATALADEMLAGILGDALARHEGEEFFHAFRRATIGKEDQGVARELRSFVKRWQALYQESRGLEWGPASLVDVTPGDWAKHKSGLAAAARRGLEDIKYTQKGQREALEKEIVTLENHVIGSGSLGSNKTTSLMVSILGAVAKCRTGPLVVKFRKEFTIAGPMADALRDLVELAARCEFSAALLRTRAVREVVAVFDSLCAKRLRSKGLLGFNDVKLLMGEWAHSEDARLRREAVDFRLDARIDHWLLDEFQDTSRADWAGLLPLVDETATDENGSVFIVGDRKQAIYAWRGGEVGLFDEVIGRYGGEMEIASMAESWRSCPEVLALVNQVCGDVTALKELFGEVAERWEWENHVPSEPLKKTANRGHARVEMVGNWDERLERLGEILHELGVGKRAMTCGILLRGNEKARETADYLRGLGFDVIEEGHREPAKDNPVGIALANLLKWLADPADAFACGVVEMSPLSNVLSEMYGSSRAKIWTGLSNAVSQKGFSETLGEVVGKCWTDWSDFGRRRAGDVLSALAEFDHQGGVSPTEAAGWIDRLEVSQSPGTAAVQVMTIHKSKGLGFDVVILPEIPDEVVPQAQRFDVAETAEWLTQTPPKWARDMIPEIRLAETRWAAQQTYEAFCMLYVALTRAKRGLHILLEPPAKSRNPEKPSLANWLARSVGAGDSPDFVHETDTGNWTENLPFLEPEAPVECPRKPGEAVPRRERLIPASTKSNRPAAARSPAGIRFGTAVHALFETVTWVDETMPAFPDTDAGRAVSAAVRNPALVEIFEKRGRTIELLREQTADAIIDGKLLSGVIDRLHLHRNVAGAVQRIEIIDFKTDAVQSPGDLVERYSSQMNAYREGMGRIYPQAEIRCLLLSVRHGAVVSV